MDIRAESTFFIKDERKNSYMNNIGNSLKRVLRSCKEGPSLHPVRLKHHSLDTGKRDLSQNQVGSLVADEIMTIALGVD